VGNLAKNLNEWYRQGRDMLTMLGGVDPVGLCESCAMPQRHGPAIHQIQVRLMTPSAFQSGVLLSKSFPEQLVLDAVHLPHQHDILIHNFSCVIGRPMGCEFSSGNLGLLS
jgi:hypothetical protein